MFNTTFSTLIALIAFFKPRAIGTQTFPLEPVGTVLSFMFPGVPSLAVFSSWVLGSQPWLFFFLLLTPWLKAALSVLPPSPVAIGPLGLHCFALHARAFECFFCIAFPRGPLAASPAFTCCASARSSTCFRTQVLCVVCAPLSSLSRSVGLPARLSELTLLNTHHMLRADCW